MYKKILEVWELRRSSNQINWGCIHERLSCDNKGEKLELIDVAFTEVNEEQFSGGATAAAPSVSTEACCSPLQGQLTKLVLLQHCYAQLNPRVPSLQSQKQARILTTHIALLFQYSLFLFSTHHRAQTWQHGIEAADATAQLVEFCFLLLHEKSSS